MRGKEAQSRDWKLEIGITPAHAGKSKSCSMLVQAMRDHPRTCGEKDEIEDISQALKGSPPHMRGKVPVWLPSPVTTGITPAHAGKRWQQYCRAGKPIGSPPHMRGKVSHLLASNSILGITPAHAGKSCQSSCSPRSCRDHPRTCGEKRINAKN